VDVVVDEDPERGADPVDAVNMADSAGFAAGVDGVDAAGVFEVDVATGFVEGSTDFGTAFAAAAVLGAEPRASLSAAGGTFDDAAEATGGSTVFGGAVVAGREVDVNGVDVAAAAVTGGGVTIGSAGLDTVVSAAGLAEAAAVCEVDAFVDGVAMVGQATIVGPAALAGRPTIVGPAASAAVPAIVPAGPCLPGADFGALETPKFTVTFRSNTDSSGIARDFRTAALPTSADTGLSSRYCTSTYMGCPAFTSRLSACPRAGARV